MPEFTLFPGPRLERKSWVYDDQARKGHWKVEDVTSRAPEFLFQDVAIAEGVTLADVFSLVGDDPVMRTVFRQDFVNELCAEVNKGAVFPTGEQSDSIEYLELYQAWSLDSQTGECSGPGRFQLHGIGPVLDADVKEDGSDYVMHAKGTRIQWGVSLTPVREMLHLPIRVNSEVNVCEDNLDAKAWGETIQTLQSTRITLGTFIRETLWELSWHGAPEVAAQVLDDLKTQCAEIEAGTVETLPCEDVFESLGMTPQKVVHAHFFANSEDFTSGEIYQAARNLDDDVPAVTGLQQVLEGRLTLRDEHRALTGRELRRAMREYRASASDLQTDDSAQ